MSKYCFRIRFFRAPSGTLSVDSNELDIGEGASSGTIILSSADRNETIRDAKQWVVRGFAWDSEEEALTKGQECMEALALTFARMHVGVDFGSLAPKSVNTDRVIVEPRTGRRVLDNIHGLMVFETEPKPLLIEGLPVTIVRGWQDERFKKAFRFAVQQKTELSESERLSLELFNASFFQHTVDTRFLLLMMAIEALLEPKPRSDEAVEHVDNLIKSTKAAQHLGKQEKDSLLSQLGLLRKQSINQAGQALMRD